ncbi:MAG: ATP-binding cassette domain-containing protein [Phycisphaerae bacterium]
MPEPMQPQSTSANEHPGTSSTAIQLARCFGIQTHRTQDRCDEPTEPVQMPKPGQILMILGPSGSGKTTRLRSLCREQTHIRCIEHRTEHDDTTVIDDLKREQEKLAGTQNDDPAPLIKTLTVCGLSEPRLWLSPISQLSQGERFRLALARLLLRNDPTGLNTRRKPTTPAIVIDEFGENLHDILTETIACNLRKLVTRRGMRLILATNRTACVRYLAPDRLLSLQTPPGTARPTESLIAGTTSRNSRRFIVMQGNKRDYAHFAHHHYRQSNELGFVDKTFTLFDRRERRAAAFVAYAHSPINLKLRNEITDRRYANKPDGVNRDFRIVRRLIVHPDYRGRGLGHQLLRVSLSKIKTRFIECLSTIGYFNPVFEKAGMIRIGPCRAIKTVTKLRDALRSWQIEPHDSKLEEKIQSDRKVRDVVQTIVSRWYAATTGEGRHRPASQSPERLAMLLRSLTSDPPMYYLWSRKKTDRKKLILARTRWGRHHHADGSAEATP